jgi:peptidyl-prolyl cis-trans isomerase-like protein 2
MAAGFTSTSLVPVTVNERAVFDENISMYRAIKTKGYVKIKTTFGDLDIELHCDQVC